MACHGQGIQIHCKLKFDYLTIILLKLKIETKYILVSKTARYVTYGELTKETKYVWLVLHGTHMVCEQMISKFKEFDPITHFIIAPEGLSRFYANGYSGEVVSTWMTSRDRLFEIEDFSNYLSELYHSFPSHLLQKSKKIILGFSQGGTTAFRWLHAKKISIDYFIGYACWIPEDIDLQSSASDFKAINTIYTYGENDEFINEDRMKSIQNIIDKNNLKIEMESFAGSHRVDQNQLKYLFEKYIQ